MDMNENDLERYLKAEELPLPLPNWFRDGSIADLAKTMYEICARITIHVVLLTILIEKEIGENEANAESPEVQMMHSETGLLGHQARYLSSLLDVWAVIKPALTSYPQVQYAQKICEEALDWAEAFLEQRDS